MEKRDVLIKAKREVEYGKLSDSERVVSNAVYHLRETLGQVGKVAFDFAVAGSMSVWVAEMEVGPLLKNIGHLSTISQGDIGKMITGLFPLSVGIVSTICGARNASSLQNNIKGVAEDLKTLLPPSEVDQLEKS